MNWINRASIAQSTLILSAHIVNECEIMMVPKTIRFSLNRHKRALKQIVCWSGSSEEIREKI